MAERSTWTVDGIEEGVARVEEDGRRMLHVPLALLPRGVGEGDVLRVEREASEGGLTIRIRIDADATRAAMEASRASAEAAPRGPDPGGDIVL